MHVVPSHRVRNRRSSYLPSQRGVVTDEGLGGFNIGKMFSRMVHFTPRSFQPKNIFGAMASVAGTVATAGLGPALAPKVFSAHSKTMQTAGTVMAAVGAAAGAAALLPAGTIAAAGSGLMKAVGGAGGLLKAGAGILTGGGGGGTQPQPQQDIYGPQPIVQQPAQIYTMPQAYDPGIYAQPVAQSMMPTMYPTMPNAAQSPGEYSSLFDLQEVSPYSQLKDVGVPPMYQDGVMLSNTTLMMIGGAVVLGLLLFTGKSEQAAPTS